MSLPVCIFPPEAAQRSALADESPDRSSAVSFAALVWVRRRPLPRAVMLIVLPGVLLASGLMAYTANLGGQIRHAEIRSGAVQTQGGPEATEHEQDDERER